MRLPVERQLDGNFQNLQNTQAELQQVEFLSDRWQTRQQYDEYEKSLPRKGLERFVNELTVCSSTRLCEAKSVTYEASERAAIKPTLSANQMGTGVNIEWRVVNSQ